MMRRRNAFTPSGFDRLEDRLTLSHLGIHSAVQLGRHHHAAPPRHHHGAHAHNHQPEAAHPGAKNDSPAPGTAPTAPVTDPTAPVTSPTAPVTNPTAPVTSPTAPVTDPTAPVTGPTAPGSSPTVTALVLNGTVEGKGPMDASGTLDPFGAVTTTGTLSATGAEPMTYSGTLSLVGASGTVTLSLSGQYFGPTSLGAPIDLTYTITGGTGAFQGATGSGKAVLSFQFPSSGRQFPTSLGNSFTLSFGDAA